MCIDKIEFLEINWIFNEIYENDSLYLQISEWSETNESRFNFVLSLAKVCGYIVLFLSIFGVLANVVVIAVLLINRKDGNISTTFILSLAVSDILIVLICGPISTVNLIVGDWAFEDYFGPFVSKIICQIFHFTYTYSVIASCYTLCLMTAERCLAVYFPLKARSYRTKSNAVKWIILVWVLDTVIMAPTFYYSDVKLTPTGCRRCYTGWVIKSLMAVSWIDFLTLYCIPLGIILVLNVAMLIRIAQMKYLWKRNVGNTKKRSNKTTVMVILIVAAFAFCWFPFQCLYLMEFCIRYCPQKVLKRKFPPEYLVSGYTLGYINSCLNPVIYSLLSVKFRKSCSITIGIITKSLSSSSKETPVDHHHLHHQHHEQQRQEPQPQQHETQL